MLRVGTSGWQYRHWRGRFYPRHLAAAHWLEYYADHFETVEVNNTFYRLPERDTFRDWVERVPDDFEFSIKASNYLTHYKRLRDPDEPVERLLAHAGPMGTRLAVVLLQLPGTLECLPDRLDATLRAFANRVRVAVEPRHPSWFCREVRHILREHDAALCLADRAARVITPEWRTTDWAYVRFHGGRGRPTSCYGDRTLKNWAARVRALYGAAPDGYVYFNNDANGCAVHDAGTFAGFAERAGVATTRVPKHSG